MSTIKVTNIKSGSTDDGGIAIDATGHVQVDGLQIPTAGALSSRNLVINGAMQVAQRGTQVTGVTTSGYRTCDRMQSNVSNLGTWTFDQSTDAPDGFSNSFKMTCTTADASPAAGDYVQVSQRIEAQNLQHLKYGTSDAVSLTVSFWVKSNKTGDASLGLLQPDASFRNVSKSYTINTADTWEYKTVTFPGDASGQIDNNNDIGLYVNFWLNSGSTFTGGSHQTSWGAQNNPSRNASNLGLGGATSDYWQITGFQVEVGEKATPFEHRSFGDELAKCQRYYWQDDTNSGYYAYQYASGTRFLPITHPVKMRATPTATVPTNVTLTAYGAGPYHYKAYGNASYSSSSAIFTNGTVKFDAEL